MEIKNSSHRLSMGTIYRMKIQMLVLLAFIYVCLTGAEKRTHDYFIYKGYKYDNIAVNSTLMSVSLQECLVECVEKETSCRYANYNMTSKLCSIGDIPCFPFESAIATSTAFSRYYTAIKGKPNEAYSCLDIQRLGLSEGSGVYTINVPTAQSTTKRTEVYCDMETDCGGWLVFKRRTDGSEDFYRGWDDYQNGFGNISNEFWLGNEDLHQILNNDGSQHELRIELGNFNDNTRFAKYSTFNIGSSADNYKLTVGGYTGDANDAMRFHNGKRFTTKDRDNDDARLINCAQERYGAWWFYNCHQANLNGRYLSGRGGIEWLRWQSSSLKFTEMKIRPKQ